MERLIAFLVCDKINPMKGVRNIVADRTVSALNQPEHLIMIQHCRRRLAGRGFRLMDIMDAIRTGEVMEDDPEDTP